MNKTWLEMTRDAEVSIRAASGLCSNESQFVRLLRADGWIARPRLNDAGAVTGYAVQSNQFPRFTCSGGKAALDLTLPRLRNYWLHDSPETRAAAVAEWTRTDGDPEAISKGWKVLAAEFADTHPFVIEFKALSEAEQLAWIANWQQEMIGEITRAAAV